MPSLNRQRRAPVDVGLPEERAQLERLVLVALVTPRTRLPRLRFATRETQPDVTPAGAPGDRIDRDRHLAAGGALVQERIVLAKAALLEIVLQGFQISGRGHVHASYQSRLLRSIRSSFRRRPGHSK